MRCGWILTEYAYPGPVIEMKISREKEMPMQQHPTVSTSIRKKISVSLAVLMTKEQFSNMH
jgi:hypothetical protein